MRAYEDAKFNEWRVQVESKLPEILKSNLLIKPKDKDKLELAMPANVDPETGKNIYNRFLALTKPS